MSSNDSFDNIQRSQGGVAPVASGNQANQFAAAAQMLLPTAGTANAPAAAPGMSMLGIAQNPMAALLPQNADTQQLPQQPQQQQPQQPQLPQQQQQQQQQQLNLTNEIKRIQQMQAQNSASNALLMPGQTSTQAHANQAALLHSMLDPKVQNPFNPMFQPGLLQDARLLMTQNQFGLAGIGGVAAAPSASEVPLPSPHSLFNRDGTRRMRGGVIEPFPEKLHRLLTECELASRSDVISWVANGRAFAIHKPDKFFKEIVPLYFRQSRLSSFKRQLNLYGFELINTGPSRGGYFHELFVKDRPELCRRMRRVAVKVSSSGKAGEDVAKEAPTDKQEESKPADIGAVLPGPTNDNQAAISVQPADSTKQAGDNNGLSSNQ